MTGHCAPRRRPADACRPVPCWPALLIIAAWLFIQVGAPRVWYYQVILGLFALLTLSNYALAGSRYDLPWRPYAYTALSLALLVYTIVVPNPFVESWPTQTRLRFDNFVYVLLFLGPIALSYRPTLMIWAGLCAALAWAVGVGWVLQLPGTITWLNLPPLPCPQALRTCCGSTSTQHFVDLQARAQDIIAVLLLAGVLALVTWRSRRLVLRQITIARERANLARYFPPTVVDELAQLDRPFAATRQQPVAVMFADIVGFTPAGRARRTGSGGGAAARVSPAGRAGDLRSRRHPRQIPGRRRDGDLRHAEHRAARCRQRPCLRFRDGRSDRPLEQRAGAAGPAADPALDRDPLRTGPARRHRVRAAARVRRAGRRRQRSATA